MTKVIQGGTYNMPDVDFQHGVNFSNKAVPGCMTEGLIVAEKLARGENVKVIKGRVDYDNYKEISNG